MTIPTAEIAVPSTARQLARGAELTPVWLNDIGGLTCHTDDARSIKWGPRHQESSMHDEAERTRWASPWICVPEVIEQGQDSAHEWLVTTAIAGHSAVDPRWLIEPAIAVPAVGAGLRMLHDALPVEECPW